MSATATPSASRVSDPRRGNFPPRANADRPRNDRRGDRSRKPSSQSAARPNGRPPSADHPILFQQFFKSVGPRTYAAQMKRASNGNHYLVFTEGQRAEANGEIRKTRLFVYSEDFVEFFRLIKAAAEFVKAHPLPDDVKRKREKFWAKQGTHPVSSPHPASRAAG